MLTLEHAQEGTRESKRIKGAFPTSSLETKIAALKANSKKKKKTKPEKTKKR